jgi:hypothetical protein
MIAGCGSSNNSSSSSSPSENATSSPASNAKLISKADACALITATDASTAAGTTVASLTGGSAVSIPGICAYGSADGTTNVWIYAQVYPDTSTAAAVRPEQIAAALQAEFGVNNATTVNGIGDKAVEYSTSGATGNGYAIFVFKTNVLLMIFMSPASSGSGVEQLAKTAVGRLGQS